MPEPYLLAPDGILYPASRAPKGSTRPQLHHLNAALTSEGVTITRESHQRGEILRLTNGTTSKGVLIPDEVLRAAQGLAKAFSGVVVEEGWE